VILLQVHNYGSQWKKSAFPPYVIFMMKQRSQFGLATSRSRRHKKLWEHFYTTYHWFFRGGVPPQGASINFQGAWVLTHPATWKVWSINLPINTFVCTAYLKSGVLETNDNHFRTTSIHKTATTARLALARQYDGVRDFVQ